MRNFTEENLPKKISIGGIEYDIVIAEDLKDGDKKLDGWIVYSQHKIFIEKALDNQARWQTLIHEILHGVLIHSGHGDKVGDEDVIDAMAYGVISVMLTTRWEDR